MVRIYGIVYAVCVYVAIVRAQEALVVVGTLRPTVWLNGVPVFASALERAQGVDAIAVSANVGVLLALVDV